MVVLSFETKNCGCIACMVAMSCLACSLDTTSFQPQASFVSTLYISLDLYCFIEWNTRHRLDASSSKKLFLK